ncbi:MAG TPA: zf-HC2 domain-containing protein [bacterium]|nr:zf-HC2 domain-containing protein [bacterium]HPN29770.1 zf-HC2 domain-containing protein [bacterium]
MECDKTKNLISDYIENILDEAAAKEIKLHLEKCQVCREYYESQKKIDSVLKKVFDSAPQKKYGIRDTEKFNDALKSKIYLQTEKFKKLKRERERKNYFLRFQNLYKYAAAFIILAVVLVAVYNETGKEGLDLKSNHNTTSLIQKDFSAAENSKLEEKKFSAAPLSSEKNEKEIAVKKNAPKTIGSFEIALNDRLDKVSNAEEFITTKGESMRQETDKTLYPQPQSLKETVGLSKSDAIRSAENFKFDADEPVKQSKTNIDDFTFEKPTEIPFQPDIMLISEKNKDVSDIAYNLEPKKILKKSKQKKTVSELNSLMTYSGKEVDFKYGGTADTISNVSRIRSLSVKDEFDSNYINGSKQKIIELYKNKKYKETVRLFEKNKRFFNNDTEILNITAESYLKIEKENFAIQNYQKSLDIDKSQIYIQNFMKQNMMRNKD